MFTDMKEALEDEALELTPTSTQQAAAASLVVARHARDKDDLADLLGVLGLPCGEDDLVRLLPHLPPHDDPTTDPTGETMPTETTNAFTAVAASMLKDGDTPEHVRATLGLSEEELADALQHVDLPLLAPAVSAASPGADSQPEPAAGATVDAEIQALLTWGEQHDAKGVQALAARARAALSELGQRRDTERAVADAEAKVGQLESELARAREELRQAKTGKPTAAPATPAPAAPATLDAAKQERNRIRAWARANGYQVADHGSIPKQVMDAWNARTDDQDVLLAQAG